MGIWMSLISISDLTTVRNYTEYTFKIIYDLHSLSIFGWTLCPMPLLGQGLYCLHLFV